MYMLLVLRRYRLHIVLGRSIASEVVNPTWRNAQDASAVGQPHNEKAEMIRILKIQTELTDTLKCMHWLFELTIQI